MLVLHGEGCEAAAGEASGGGWRRGRVSIALCQPLCSTASPWKCAWHVTAEAWGFVSMVLPCDSLMCLHGKLLSAGMHRHARTFARTHACTLKHTDGPFQQWRIFWPTLHLAGGLALYGRWSTMLWGGGSGQARCGQVCELPRGGMTGTCLGTWHDWCLPRRTA